MDSLDKVVYCAAEQKSANSRNTQAYSGDS